jgi:hypothetical protein
MSRKLLPWLLLFPYASILAGTPIHAPHLREKIPATSCRQHETALELYLLAYAWAAEDASQSARIAEQAAGRLEACGPEEALLRERLRRLKERLLRGP